MSADPEDDLPKLVKFEVHGLSPELWAKLCAEYQARVAQEIEAQSDQHNVDISFLKKAPKEAVDAGVDAEIFTARVRTGFDRQKKLQQQQSEVATPQKEVLSEVEVEKEKTKQVRFAEICKTVRVAMWVSSAPLGTGSIIAAASNLDKVAKLIEAVSKVF